MYPGVLGFLSAWNCAVMRSVQNKGPRMLWEPCLWEIPRRRQSDSESCLLYIPAAGAKVWGEILFPIIWQFWCSDTYGRKRYRIFLQNSQPLFKNTVQKLVSFAGSFAKIICLRFGKPYAVFYRIRAKKRRRCICTWYLLSKLCCLDIIKGEK